METKIAIAISIWLILLFVPELTSAANPDSRATPSIPQQIIPAGQHDYTLSLKFTSQVSKIAKGHLQIVLEFPDEFPVISTYEESTQERQVQFALSSDYQLSYQRGKPSLPFYVAYVAVPHDADGFEISHLNVLQIQKNLYEPLTINEIVEETNVIVVDEKVVLIKKARLRDVTFLTIQIFPVEYDVDDQILLQTKVMQFDLKFQSESFDDLVLIKNPDENVFHKIYQNQFLNYQWVEDFSAPENSSIQQGEFRVLSSDDIINPGYANSNQFFPDYLVIRSQAFINSASFNTWLDYRISEQGGSHVIGVISLETLYSAYPSGTDKQTRIKNCISFLYQNWRQSATTADLVYLLFIGDADYGQDSQPWFMPTWDSNDQITGITGDNKYGCLVGTDDIPELLIGRLPVKNEAELNTIISKTLSFEATIPQGENHFGTRNLFLGSSDTNLYGPTANGARDILLNHFQESKEFINTANYNRNINAPYYNNYTFTNLDPMITNLINEKGFLVISYNGDGGTEEGWQPENIDIDGLVNHDQLTALVISASSRTGRFDWTEGDCFGERMIKKNNGGAVSFFGPSRKTIGYAFSADEHILKAIYEDHITVLGLAALQARVSLEFENWDDRIRFNFFGDPAIDISDHIGQSTKPETVLTFNATFPPHPLAGDEVTLNACVHNVGKGPAEGLAMQFMSIDFSNNWSLLGSPKDMPYMPENTMFQVNEQWFYQEYSAEQFNVKTNDIEELSNFNNVYKDKHWIQYPMHFNANNTTGIENGSFEHPFTKFSYSGSNWWLFGFQKVINSQKSDLKVYIYPGVYGAELGHGNNFEIGNMQIIGVGAAQDIIINGDSFTALGDVRMPSLFKNLTFQNLDIAYGSACLINNGSNLNVEGCVFKNNQAAIQFENYWSWLNETQGTLTQNIFYDNVNALKLIDEKVTMRLINNVVFSNDQFLDLSQGLFDSNELLIKNNIIRENTAYWPYPWTIMPTNNYNNTDIPDLLTYGQNNMSLDPQFINPYFGDFHLQPMSPCVNAGDPNPIYNDPDGSRNDIGAYGGKGIYKSIRIMSPSDGISLIASDTSYPLSIKWETELISKEESIKVTVFHEIVGTQKRDNNTISVGSFKGSTRIVEFEIVVPNTGLISCPLSNLTPFNGWRVIRIELANDPETNAEHKFIFRNLPTRY